MRKLPLSLLTILLASPAAGAQLPVASWEASSVLVDKDKGLSYPAANMADGLAGGMWIEGEGSAGLGTYIQVKFAAPVELAKIRIWGGCFVSDDFWKRHNRVKEVELKFPDFTSQRVAIEDKMEAQWITLLTPKTVESVKIYLRSVYSGSTWNDTPITEMEFYDTKGIEGIVSGAKATATSSYDKTGEYDAPKAVDGWADTWWVDGTPGSGQNESVSVDFTSEKSLKRFALSTGADQTDTAWAASNRANKVTLTFSNGSTQSFAVADKKGLQSFELQPVRSRSVKVTIDGVTTGGTRNELYIGELRFWE